MTKEALKLALEALETPWNAPYVDGCDLALGKKVKAITAIKEALANEALEKMAENARELGLDYEPPQRKPLTDEEIQKCYETTGHYQTLRPQDRFAVLALARAIEAAHGIKEST